MKIIAVFFCLMFIWKCSGGVDTTQLGPEEHFEYAMSLFNDEDYEDVTRELQSILLQYPGSSVNDDAQYYLGFTYFKKEQYLLAAYEFSKLIRNIPASPFVADAQYGLAEAYYQLSPPYPLEQSYTKKAVEEFQAFLDFFPGNSRVEEAEQKIHELNLKLAEKEYNSGYIYEKMEYSTAAIDYYTYVFETYHDTKFAPLALYKKIDILLQKERTDEAIRNISIFLERYPEHIYARELGEMQVSLLD